MDRLPHLTRPLTGVKGIFHSSNISLHTRIEPGGLAASHWIAERSGLGKVSGYEYFSPPTNHCIHVLGLVAWQHLIGLLKGQNSKRCHAMQLDQL